MSKVIELTDDTFAQALEKAPLAFVDFYADWCGPCRLFSPVFARVAEKHPGLAFFKIDGDLHPNSRAGITIDNLPFVAAFRSGKLVEGFSTTMEAGIETFIARLVESK